MTKVTRREFLALGAATTAGILVGGCAAPIIEMEDGDGYQTLEVQWLYKTLNGLKTKLRSYNGQVPGPTLVTHPGEALKIRIKNSLTPYDSSGWTGDHNIPHNLNTTNLHVHGLDVAPHLFEPLGTTDPKAPMVQIGPGESYPYVFQLPGNHPPGLFWYHPHNHGSTAVQAVSGMAGAIIVKGDIDEVPEIKAARDIVLAIQDIGLFPSETEADVWTYEPKQNAIWQTFPQKVPGIDKDFNVTIYDPEKKEKVVQQDLKGGFSTGDYAERFYLLNGEPFFQETHANPPPNCPPAPTPTQFPVQQFKLAPGEVVRFRMLNGCSDNLMPIVVDGHELHLIALDGVNFSAPRTIRVYTEPTGDGQLLLAPANRAEFLIRAGEPGRYAIRELSQDQQFLSSAAKMIAEIVVEGPAKNMALPTTLPTPQRYYPLIDKVSRTRTLEFAGMFPATKNPYVGLDFQINGMLYEEDTVQQEVTLGDAEEWILQVADMAHGGTEGHPFHIHVNHFEVISIGGVPQPPGTIKDTIWIPNGKGKDVVDVVIRMKFNEFKGKSVYHCHILPHEDTGMMQNFLIKEP